MMPPLDTPRRPPSTRAQRGAILHSEAITAADAVAPVSVVAAAGGDPSEEWETDANAVERRCCTEEAWDTR